MGDAGLDANSATTESPTAYDNTAVLVEPSDAMDDAISAELSRLADVWAMLPADVRSAVWKLINDSLEAAARAAVE